jgi:hypothetical protein
MDHHAPLLVQFQELSSFIAARILSAGQLDPDDGPGLVVLGRGRYGADQESEAEPGSWKGSALTAPCLTGAPPRPHRLGVSQSGPAARGGDRHRPVAA